MQGRQEWLQQRQEWLQWLKEEWLYGRREGQLRLELRQAEGLLESGQERQWL